MRVVLLGLSLVIVIAMALVVSFIVITTEAKAVVIPTKTIAGFTNDTIQTAIDNQNRRMNIALLHNASIDKQFTMFSVGKLYYCINIALNKDATNSSSPFYSTYHQLLQNCDSAFSSALALARQKSNANSTLTVPATILTGFQPRDLEINLHGANQTELKIAADYLKSRGIQ